MGSHEAREVSPALNQLVDSRSDPQLAGRYGYSVTRIGWLRRVSGDEYELLGGRTIARTGSYQLGGINKLAGEGPGKGYNLSEADKMPEELHRLLIRRSLPASEKAWAASCPKPEGWVER